MAFLAKRLPVIHIPEQALIAAMRKHMIHDGRRGQLPVSLTGDAQRMTPQVGVSRLAPLPVISTESSAAAQPIVALSEMFFAVDLPLFAESGAAGIAAGASRFHGHYTHLTVS